MKIFMLKRIIPLAIMFAIIVAAYWSVMQDVKKLNDDDVFICVDTVKECKVYVSPKTFKVTGENSFDVTVKKFFYNQLLVTEEKFSFRQDGDTIFYSVDNSDKNFKIANDKIATEIWNYFIKSLKP